MITGFSRVQNTQFVDDGFAPITKNASLVANLLFHTVVFVPRRLLSQRSIKSISSENQGDSPPMYEIQRKEVKQIEIGNRTHKIMTTKFTLFTPKPPENQSLLSPVSASRHTLLVQKRLFESSGYMVMVDIQYSDGYW